jgi:hypothetical protein
MADHDQIFKQLLQTFFAEFIRLFFAEWADRFDFSKVDFLQGEMFTDVPEGERRTVDVLARLPVRQGIEGTRPGQATSWLALVHVEIEAADRVAPLRPRMFDYYCMLRKRYLMPVLPIALYLRVGLDGVGWDIFEEYFWEQRLVYFRYAYIGLPALDGAEFIGGENILGVALAALMRVPPERRAELKAASLKRVEQSNEDDARKHLLGNIIQTYRLLDEEQQTAFDRLMSREEYSGVAAMITTWADLEREKGRMDAKRNLVQTLLKKRYSALDPAILSAIESWSGERLEEVLMGLYEGKTLADLGLGHMNGETAE